jgi:TonB dependent receptor-like, beta-barrel
MLCAANLQSCDFIRRGAGGAARRILILAVVALLNSTLAIAAMPSQEPLRSDATQRRPSFKLSVTVLDENGVPVSAARAILESGGAARVMTCETDFAGRCEFSGLAYGLHGLRVEKEGYFAVAEKGIEVGKVEGIDVTLNHQRESVERVNVVYSPPAIDLKKTTDSARLSDQEIIELPYTVSRDIRNALPMLPEVIQDGTGQVHVAGSDTRQTYDRLDGFNINAPVSGLLTLRVSVDAVRSINVETSRSPAEFGKGSGGVLDLTTGMGDDRFRFSTTDVIPSLQSRYGFHINTWTPRVNFSGPLKKGRAWFMLAPEGEYDQDIVHELPPGANRDTAVRYGNLAKFQINLAEGNILRGTYLLNRYRAYNVGLSVLDPLETTLNLRQAADFFNLKDQITLFNGGLLEFGAAWGRFRSGFHPKGNAPYVITPEKTSGNYFETGDGHSSRLQGIINWFLPVSQWHGRHEIKVGTDLDRLTFEQSFHRNPFQVFHEDGTLSRQVAFSPISPYGRDNFEVSAYAEDHWSLNDRCVVDPGIRVDWDQVDRDPLISPRLATNYLATRDGKTKITAGIGLYYDPSNLELSTRQLGGERVDSFYDTAGQALLQPPAVTFFQVNDKDLKGQQYLNWSVGVERKLPHAVYLDVGFLEKRGRHGWTFRNATTAQASTPGGVFQLTSSKRDRYDALDVSARKAFANGHQVFVAYTRSAARSNSVVDFSLENPVFGPQAAGALPWDCPNRLISWGWLPLRHRFEMGYWVEWRDGFPFGAVNQNQQRVGPPDSHRFPTYFALNLSVERRIRLFGFQWAVRAGINNITNRHNPTVVNNNVDSPQFLTFRGIQGRSLVGRLRLIGEK